MYGSPASHNTIDKLVLCGIPSEVCTPSHAPSPCGYLPPRAFTDAVSPCSSGNTLLAEEVALRNDIGKDLPLVLCDSHRLSQILYNILGNACKFTSTGSISVRVPHCALSATTAGAPVSWSTDYRFCASVLVSVSVSLCLAVSIGVSVRVSICVCVCVCAM